MTIIFWGAGGGGIRPGGGRWKRQGGKSVDHQNVPVYSHRVRRIVKRGEIIKKTESENRKTERNRKGFQPILSILDLLTNRWCCCSDAMMLRLGIAQTNLAAVS
jgi:hypothetical protein